MSSWGVLPIAAALLDTARLIIDQCMTSVECSPHQIHVQEDSLVVIMHHLLRFLREIHSSPSASVFNNTSTSYFFAKFVSCVLMQGVWLCLMPGLRIQCVSNRLLLPAEVVLTFMGHSY
jgi:hypothetical protein